jgi:hypothetical protein
MENMWTDCSRCITLPLGRHTMSRHRTAVCLWLTCVSHTQSVHSSQASRARCHLSLLTCCQRVAVDVLGGFAHLFCSCDGSLLIPSSSHYTQFMILRDEASVFLLPVTQNTWCVCALSSF